MDHGSAIRRPDGYKWAINRKKNNDAIISDMTSLSAFLRFPVSRVKFSYWPRLALKTRV